jgi:hypothetical protein
MTTEKTERDEWVIDYPADAEPVRSPSLPPTKSDRKLKKHYEQLVREYGTEFYRTIAQIKKDTRLSRQTIWRGNQRLRKLGHISWITGHGALGLGGEANRYKWHTPHE